MLSRSCLILRAMRLAYAIRLALSRGDLAFRGFPGYRSTHQMARKKEKDPHAVYLGRRGGKARIQKLSPEQRSEIARKAARVRWAREKKTLTAQP